MKKLVLFALVLFSIVSLSACKNDVKLQHFTIGVAHYSDSGPSVTAIKSYLEGLGEALDFEVIYTKLTQTDEATNLTKIQELIAAGADGILISMDLGMPSIVEECEAAGVYLAGFLSDFDTSYRDSFEEVYESEYFLGTVADGYISTEIDRGNSFFRSLIEYNTANPTEKIDHVSMVVFPTWAFPTHHTAAAQFVAAVNEYNKTATTPITVDPLDSEVDIISFRPISSTYFTKHPGIDAVISFAAGAGFVYPPMVNAGLHNSLKIFTSGWEQGMDDNFATTGAKTYQHTEVVAIESLTYSLVLMLNKLYGVEFDDMPEVAQRISLEPIVINSESDLTKFKTNIYYTGLYEDAFLDSDAVLNLTAFGNSNSTYAGLLEALSQMTINDIQ
ncbi:sugar ABC transporter substrate-binding protein [Paracholeplasma manati]|uniref:sugar ABC transporter substrate-binding protein n=1 Tax=Paracholeplasma manati TaxID=591373 RepID=UPI002407F391|nr:hypothetical protein [Paracholeplasma manati]MDG0888343.1 hypothetical protein [Paracholeplasma manati]